MENTATFADKWNGFMDKIRPGMQATGRVFSLIGNWIFRLRKVLLSVPVLVTAIYLAVQNMKLLPEQVGIMGFDNIRVLNSISPRLASVDCEITGLGRKAFQALLQMINGDTEVREYITEYTIIEGESL